jgi:hypothetical protein
MYTATLLQLPLLRLLQHASTERHLLPLTRMHTQCCPTRMHTQCCPTLRYCSLQIARSKAGVEIPDDIGRMILMHMYKADEVRSCCMYALHICFSEVRFAVESTRIAVCFAVLTYL